MNFNSNEIKKRMGFKCKHGHNGLTHKNCYDVAHNIEERIGFLDIEAEDLSADYGIMFNWCILDGKTNKIHQDVITLEDIKNGSSKSRNVPPREDKRITQSLIKTLENYDRVVAHYGSRYDVPFIRTRAVICGVDFPTYGMLNQTDTWVILKNKFKLSRNSLQNATLKLLGQTRKDHLSLAVKHGCLRGEKWALDISVQHCRKDVLDLRDLYNEIHWSMKKTKTSI